MLGALIHLASGAHAHAANVTGGILLLLGTAAYLAAFSFILMRVADAKLAAAAKLNNQEGN